MLEVVSRCPTKGALLVSDSLGIELTLLLMRKHIVPLLAVVALGAITLTELFYQTVHPYAFGKSVISLKQKWEQPFS